LYLKVEYAMADNIVAHQENPIRHNMALGILATMVMLAFVLRVWYLDSSHHVAEVQYRSYLITRSMYFNLSDSIPEWRRQANRNSIENLTEKNLVAREPPITEFVTVAGYKVYGREDIRVARLLTTIYWLIGAIFLYKTVRRWETTEAGLVAAAYFLFIPLGVILSISFQADALMMMLFIMSLFALLRYVDKPSSSTLLVAAALSGMTFLVRPLVIFTVSAAFIVLSLYRARGFRHLFKTNLVFFGISCTPIVLYYGYQIFISGHLMEQVEVSFIPGLLFTWHYWRDWLLTVVGAIGLFPLLAAIIGIPLTRRPDLRALLIGLYAGYFVFCLVFSYHIRYAYYYHLQLIPIVALSFTPLVTGLLNYIRTNQQKWYWSSFYVAALLLLMIANLADVHRSILYSSNIESREVAKTVGDFVQHSDKVVYIASYYGWPLEYFAELSGTYWPRSISDLDAAFKRQNPISVQERLDRLWFTPEYFVITDLQEYINHHSDLKEYLETNCRVLTQHVQYLIYDSCKRDP
jgi:hypothetical protein